MTKEPIETAIEIARYGFDASPVGRIKILNLDDEMCVTKDWQRHGGTAAMGLL